MAYFVDAIFGNGHLVNFPLAEDGGRLISDSRLVI